MKPQRVNLDKARKAKNDEYYTRLEDIETEIGIHPDYIRHFKNRTVLCNCDDPTISNFYLFFRRHFQEFGLNKLIAVHYNTDGSSSYKLEWQGEKLGGDTVNLIKIPLQGDGDFRSAECIEILKMADIVVTNPPFSLFREYVAQLIEYEKKFIILGNTNAIGYKEIFPFLQANKIWLGYHSTSADMLFHVPDEFKKELQSTKKKGSGYRIVNGQFYARSNAVWFTNLDIDKHHKPLLLKEKYYGNESKYPTYDNCNAINVNKITDIPCDYDGVMGVPITFMDKFCPEQFEIVAFRKGYDGKDVTYTVNGKKIEPYSRILIHKINT